MVDLPKCSICAEAIKLIYVCKECGAKFCKDCGDHKTELCSDCVEYNLNLNNDAQSELMKDMQNELSFEDDFG